MKVHIRQSRLYQLGLLEKYEEYIKTARVRFYVMISFFFQKPKSLNIASRRSSREESSFSGSLLTIRYYYEFFLMIFYFHLCKASL